jgi:hypothetical protein
MKIFENSDYKIGNKGSDEPHFFSKIVKDTPNVFIEVKGKHIDELWSIYCHNCFHFFRCSAFTFFRKIKKIISLFLTCAYL